MSATQNPSMIVFDTAYSYQIIRDRGLEASITSRDLGGFFDHVFTVHSLAGLLYSDDERRIGPPQCYEITPRHSFIEGRTGRFLGLKQLRVLNFLLAQFAVLRLAIRIVRRNNVRVIRAEDNWYSGVMAYVVARLTSRPLIIGIWGNPEEIRRRTGAPVWKGLFKWMWLERVIERWILRSADLSLAQNEDNRRYILDQGVPVSKTALFRLGNLLHPAHFVDVVSRPDPATDLAALGVQPGDELLLSISRLIPAKLLDDIVEVLARLAPERPRLKLLFGGDGEHRPVLEALAVRLGVRERVIFCGNQDQHWLARVLRATHVVVSPWTGRALAEAALGEAPIAAYDIDWQSEVVVSGETGELVECRDVEALTGAVRRLLEDRERARRLGKNARKRILETMHPDAVDQAQREIYCQVLDPRSSL